MMKRFQYQPGNMTSYDLIYGKVGNGYLLVNLSRGGSGGGAFRFDDGIFIAAGYLADKMGIPKGLMGDAYALCAFLNTQGHTAEAAGNFDSNGQYVRYLGIERAVVEVKREVSYERNNNKGGE